jgi:hypothetical protein
LSDSILTGFAVSHGCITRLSIIGFIFKGSL